MMHMEIRGQGQPLLWFHAFPCSSRMWEGELAYYADRYQVIAVDFPGFGRSTAYPPATRPLGEAKRVTTGPGGGRRVAPDPMDEGGFTMMKAAKGVHEELVKRGITQPVILGGLSMGGYIAFEYMRAFHKEVKALILVGTKAAADSEEAKEGRYKTIETIKTSGLEAFVRMFVPKALGQTSLAERPQVVEQLKAMVEEASPAVVMDALRGLASRRDSVVMLRFIACPTLVIWGEEDKLIPLADHQVIQSGIQGAVLERIPKAGHMVNLEAPEAFHAAVDRLLAKVS